jgi:hypothetical protein
MLDEKKWTLAGVRLQAMRKSIPTYVDKDMVAEYHGILTAFEEASGEDFSTFRIPDSKITPRVTSIQIGSSRRPGRSHYSSESYCRGEYFERQIEGVAAYLPHLQNPNSSADPRDYDSMSNQQLEDLAAKYNIGSYGDARGGIDRRIIITALRERDRALHQVNGEAPASSSPTSEAGGQSASEPDAGKGFDGDRNRVPCRSKVRSTDKEINGHPRKACHNTYSGQDSNVAHGPIWR